MIIEAIAPDDDMLIEADHYFRVGEQLAQIAASTVPSDFKGRVLEVPSGHGRVTRHLLAQWPEATITAADVLPSAVAFQREVLRTNAVLIEAPYLDYRQLSDRAFDLVVMGSLITHLSEVAARTILQQVSRKLVIGGTFVVTTHGTRSAEILRASNPYQIADDAVRILLEAFDAGGFGFAPYATDHSSEKNTVDHIGSEYGISLSAPGWIERELEALGFAQESYTIGGWDNHQDVVIARLTAITPSAR